MMPRTEIAKRLMRWMLPSEQRAALALEHPAQADIAEAADEIERLALENWQLKGALGYPAPGDIPQGDFKCGMCEARTVLPTKYPADPLTRHCQSCGKIVSRYCAVCERDWAS